MNLFSRLGVGWQVDLSQLGSTISSGIVQGLMGGTGGTPTYLTPDQLAQIQKVLSGQATAAAAPTIQNLQTQLAAVDPNADIARQQATQQAGFAQQGLGLSGEQLGLTKEGTARQLSELPQQQDWAKQLLGIQTGALGRQQALQPQLQGLTEQGFALQGGALDRQQEQLDYNSLRQQQALQGGLAASGATNTVGAGRQLEDLAKQKGWSQQSLDQARTQLGLSKQGEELGYGETMAGLADQAKGLDISGQQMNQQFGDIAFNLGQQAKGEDITGRQLGLQGQEITAGLGNQLQNIGIGAQAQKNTLGYELGAQGASLGQALQGVGQTVAGYATGGYQLPPGMTSQDITNLLSGNPIGAPAPPAAPAQPAQPAKPAAGAPQPGAAKTGFPTK
jgi:hypothetical protein